MLSRKSAGGLAIALAVVGMANGAVAPATAGDLSVLETHGDLIPQLDLAIDKVTGAGLAEQAPRPTLATLLATSPASDPFGPWLAAGIGDMGLAESPAAAWSLVPATESPGVDLAVRVEDDGRSLGTSLAALLAGGPEGAAARQDIAAAEPAAAEAEDSVLPGWRPANFDSLTFDFNGMVRRLRSALFGTPGEAGEDEGETAVAAAPTIAVPASGAQSPRLQVLPDPLLEQAPREVALPGEIVELREAAPSADPDPVVAAAESLPAQILPTDTLSAETVPSAAELAARAPRSLGVLNLSRPGEIAPAPDYKVARVTPGILDAGTLDEVLHARSQPQVVVPEPPSAPAARPEPVPQTEPEPRGELEFAALMPRQPEAAIAPEARPEIAIPTPAVRVRPTPPKPRLRPFNAASHGIRVIPGSSAASLAHMLEDVSNRPASAGFGPVLTASERRMGFDELIGKSGRQGTVAIGAAASKRAMPARAPRSNTLVTGARDLRQVLTTEGAYLQ